MRTARSPRWTALAVRSCLPEVAQAVRAVPGLIVRTVAQAPSAAADLEAARQAGSYLDALSANTRQQIRRALRLYEERGPVRLERAATVDQALALFRELLELHRARWLTRGHEGAAGAPGYIRMHEGLIRAALPEGRVELVRVRAGDRTIGCLYNFLYRGCVSFYISGLAFEDDNRLKPGLVTHALCAQDHLERGARLYDFMAGENRYKTSLGSPTAPMESLTAQRADGVAQAETLLRRLLGRD